MAPRARGMGALAICFVGAFIASACARPECLELTCTPGVSHTPAAGAQKGEDLASVDVYWDVSGSMADFGSIHNRLEELLDSKVLNLAGASTVRHFLIGDEVKELKDLGLRSLNDRPARGSSWSALHRAAQQIGERSGRVGASVLVSDLVLEVPLSVREGGEGWCSEVPVPTSQFAGPAFGRCFASGLAQRKPTGMYAEVLQHSAGRGGRHMYVAVLAENVRLGLAIGNELRRRMAKEFSFRVMANTNAWREAVHPNPRCTSGASKSVDACPLQPEEAAGGLCRLRCEAPGDQGVTCSTGLPAFATGAQQQSAQQWLEWSQPRVSAVVRDAQGSEISGRIDARGSSPASIELILTCGGASQGNGELEIHVTTSVKWTTSSGEQGFEEMDDNARDAIQSLARALAGALSPVEAKLTIQLFER